MLTADGRTLMARRDAGGVRPVASSLAAVEYDRAAAIGLMDANGLFVRSEAKEGRSASAPGRSMLDWGAAA
jgi:hypothetical protein